MGFSTGTKTLTTTNTETKKKATGPKDKKMRKKSSPLATSLRKTDTQHIAAQSGIISNSHKDVTKWMDEAFTLPARSLVSISMRVARNKGHKRILYEDVLAAKAIMNCKY